MEAKMEQTENTENEQDQELATEALTPSDRCDVCGAQAFIRAVLASGDLIFCAHHGMANQEKLKPIAILWQDETDKIN